MFKIRDFGSIKFFFEIKIIRKKKTIFLVQNIYMKKLMKKYKIDSINIKIFVISIFVDLKAFDDKTDIIDIH